MKRHSNKIAALLISISTICSGITAISAVAASEKTIQAQKEIILYDQSETSEKKNTDFSEINLKRPNKNQKDFSFAYQITGKEPLIELGVDEEKGDYIVVIKRAKRPNNDIIEIVLNSLPEELGTALLKATGSNNGGAIFCTDMTSDMIAETIDILSPLFEVYVFDKTNEYEEVKLNVRANISSCVLKYGETAELKAYADGGIGDLSYKWFKNGVIIKGATSDTYTATEPARYSCTVTDSVGLKSSTGTINVVSTLSFAKLPENVTIIQGSSADMSVEISGGLAPYTYLWYKNNVEIPNSNSATYTATSAGQYKCKVTDSLGQSITGRYGTVSIAPELRISVDLNESQITPGSGTRLRIQTSGGYGSLSYQWYKDDSPISGAKSSDYVTSTAGNYYCIVTDSLGQTVKSKVCKIVEKLSIASNPSSAIIAPGKSAKLSISVKGGAAPYSYQWYKGGNPISYATSDFYYAYTSGSYYCVVKDALNQEVSSYTAQITVADKLAITNKLPESLILYRKDSGHTYTVYTTGGYGSKTYQWYKNGTIILGATKSTYTATCGGTYFCKVSDSLGQTIFSNEAKLYDELYLSSQSSDKIINKGVFTTLSVSVTGGSPEYTYQWYETGIKIKGATSSSYRTTTPGRYSCVIKDSLGQKVETGYINVIEKLKITKQPVKCAIMATYTSKTPVSVKTSGGYGRVRYQWYRNGHAISGATSSDYNIYATGNYTCRIWDEYGQTLKTNICYACLKLQQTGKTQGTTIKKGTSLPVSFSVKGGTQPYSYQWYKNTFNNMITGATSSVYNVTETGYYACRITDVSGQVLYTDYISVLVK
ncbi:immunoglobulin domain-containing protein [Ruminococcus flavefaciens]|uniref:Ig-like domain-containing protein n=1 Tax=Ruminococcus flavefaciens TaxID=1265 RepID=A0A1M7HNY5_RUMFL|nr:immunoglobulin domain-containing protein [Ruminococcus flavefaciens]SHM30205.1 hypothetical protein SAMN04487860_1038 [Ruminococcus flavefaciens]